jgi:hypothetical protein
LSITELKVVGNAGAQDCGFFDCSAGSVVHIYLEDGPILVYGNTAYEGETTGSPVVVAVSSVFVTTAVTDYILATISLPISDGYRHPITQIEVYPWNLADSGVAYVRYELTGFEYVND